MCFLYVCLYMCLYDTIRYVKGVFNKHKYVHINLQLQKDNIYMCMLCLSRCHVATRAVYP